VLALLAIVAIVVIVPPSRSPQGGPLDVVSALLSVIGLGARLRGLRPCDCRPGQKHWKDAHKMWYHFLGQVKLNLDTGAMITEEKYSQYIKDFNAVCADDGADIGAFYDKYYEPDAVFEYIPDATKNVGKDVTVAFWSGVREIMREEIKDHISFLSSDTAVASEAPIDFQCRKDLEWVGVKHKAGSSFRLRMAAFYEVSARGKFKYVRVYSVYHPDYQVN
jgi:hypothetical protein